MTDTQIHGNDGFECQKWHKTQIEELIGYNIIMQRKI